MNEADGYAGKAVVFTLSGGKLQRAQVKQAKTFEGLLSIARKHFGARRALALVPTSEKAPQA